MHGPLSLDVSHDLAALSQVQLSPVLNIHLQDIRLRELLLYSRDHLEVSLAKKRRHRSVLVLEASLKGLVSLLYCFLFLLESLSEYHLELFRGRRWLYACLFGFSSLFSELLSFLRGDVLILKVLAVLIPELLALIYDGQEAGHGEAHLEQVRVAVELLGKLLRNEQVRLQLVLLLQEHIPELVEVVMILQAQLLCSPGATGRQVLSGVSLVAGEGIEVLDGARGRLGDGGGWAAIHRTEIVPVYAHII